MKTIKFRAWGNFDDGQRMTDDFYVNNSGKPSVWNPLEGKLEDFDWPLMQFTGLLDKNGKEIWEGDILQDSDGNKLGEVIWEGNAFQLKLPDDITNYDTELELEIIGNIYENPELITPPTKV